MKKLDLMCQKFGRLRVVGDIEERDDGCLQWLCHCDCGNDLVARSRDLRSGNTKSCGCLKMDLTRVRFTTHGYCKEGKPNQEYTTWKGMRQRCNDPNADNYPRYGGRGISVCARWSDFSLFLADMGPRPEGTSIDRINNDGNYEPGNCRWATAVEQQNNRRKTNVML